MNHGSAPETPDGQPCTACGKRRTEDGYRTCGTCRAAGADRQAALRARRADSAQRTAQPRQSGTELRRTWRVFDEAWQLGLARLPHDLTEEARFIWLENNGIKATRMEEVDG